MRRRTVNLILVLNCRRANDKMTARKQYESHVVKHRIYMLCNRKLLKYDFNYDLLLIKYIAKLRGSSLVRDVSLSDPGTTSATTH